MANKRILIDIKVTDAQASSNIKKTTKAVDGLAKSTEILQGRTSKNKATSGLNNTILQETGRLASDAAYGFQGMANNLGQLVSLFQIAAKNSGGWGAALKDVGKSLTGVGGILIAVQLLISFLPQISAGLSKLINKTTDLDKALKKSSMSFAEQISNLDVYVKKLNDTNTSEEERKNIIKTVNEEYEGLNLNLDENNNLTETSNNNLEIYNTLLKQRAEQEAILSLIQEKAVEKARMMNSGLLESAGVFNVLKAIGKSILNPFAIVEGITENITGDVSKLNEEINALLKSLKVVAPDAKETGDALKKAFVAGDLDFDNEIVKSMARVSSSLAFNEELKIKIQSESQKKLARIRQQDFADRQQKRVDAIKNDEDRAKAQIAVDASIAESQASLYIYLDQLDEEAKRKINQRRIDDITKASSLLAKEMESRAEAQKSFEVSMAENEFNRFDRQRELSDIERDNTIKNLELKKNAAIVAGKSTIGIEEQITNATLLNADKKKKINEDEQQAKLDTANFVGQAITAIAGEGSAVGKAVAVAMATMNTYQAVTAALGATPYGPWNIAQAAATAAFGFLQVKNILSTPTPGGSSSGGGGAAGGGTVNAPDFNVVGTSETSQLAQAVGGREDSVVRAYVVGSEITSQQELDRKITNTAGL